MEHQFGNVFATIGQSGNRKGHHIEAVKRSSRKTPLLDHALHVASGGGNDTNIDLDGLLSANADEFAGGQDTRQFALNLLRQIGDFFEIDGATWASSRTPISRGLVPSASVPNRAISNSSALKWMGEKATNAFSARWDC